MTMEPGYNLNRTISLAHDSWDLNFRANGGDSPWHQVVSQLMAVIPDDGDALQYVDLLIENPQELETLTLDMIIFTEDLLLRSELKQGGSPTLRVIPRNSLSDLRILSTPIATYRQTGSAWTPHSVELTYQHEVIVVPRVTKVRGLSDKVGALIPSLIRDLQAKK